MDDPFAHLVITRRRKKYKFAHFESFSNTFTFSGTNINEFKNKIDKITSSGEPLILELAAGTAKFSLELAKRNPQSIYIAIDIKSDRLYTSAKAAVVEKIENILFLRMPITEIGQFFQKNSVNEIWLTFPDPHPKKRSSKHRLTHISFLRQYREILKKSGVLYFKTDNLSLFQWSLEQFVADDWQISELSFDLHESELPSEYKIKTDYEQKFIAQGLPIYYCCAQPAVEIAG